MEVTRGSTVPLQPPPELAPIDHSAPLRGAILCCTSIPPDTRTALARHAEQMGAQHKYDLTSEVTHLIVGEYDTPKYRYVAKERPDVKILTPSWIEAVRQLWMADQVIDLNALEKQHTLPTLATLKVCMTGFDEPERSELINLVSSNGGSYHGDLTKAITHLIARRPEGKKYKFAKDWKLQLVSAEWLYDSIGRGMILDEKLYHPELPPEERGKGAWVRRRVTASPLGKRLRDNDVLEDGSRKLRRTFSTKLTSQNEVIWDDIVGVGGVLPQNAEKQGQAAPNVPVEDPTSQQTLSERSNPGHDLSETKASNGINRATFSQCRFCIYGFEKRKTNTLRQHLLSHDADVRESHDDLHIQPHIKGYMVVPHDFAVAELPAISPNISIVTDWWVERCLEAKTCLGPSSSTFDLPFPHLSIERFEKLTVSTTGFTGFQLLHLSKVIALMGAKYDEFFSEKTSALICNVAHQVRIEKLQRAKEWRIPVVSIDWLLESIKTGSKQPYKPYILRSKVNKTAALGERPSSQGAPKKEVEYDCFEALEAIPLLKSANPQVGNRPTKPIYRDSTAFDDDDGEPTEAIGGFLIPKKAATPQDPRPALLIDSATELPPERLTEISPTSPCKSPTSLLKQSVAALPANNDTQEISSAITSLLAKSRNPPNSGKSIADGSEATTTRKPSRILGRATSNVSAVSRASSVDSTASGGQAVHWPAAKRKSLCKVDSLGSLAGGLVEEAEKIENQPPLTQRLQYEDEEGELYKAQVIARMTGRKPEKREKERVATVGSLDDTPRGRNLRTRVRGPGMI